VRSRHYGGVTSRPAFRVLQGGGEPSPAPPGAPSFDEVFRQYSPYVAAIGLRLLGRPAEVDDLVQDVFLRAHRGLGALRQPEALKGWLAAVTVRVARRRLHARRLWRFIGADEYDYTTIADPRLGPDELAVLADAYRVLDRLPAGPRLAWLLRHLEGEPLERVAELCGCSLATAKRWIGRAHATIRGGTRDER
jgi:RNA polymerase sigma-70 factor, ECF subfamily